MRPTVLVLALLCGAAFTLAPAQNALAHESSDATPREKALHMAVTVEHATLKAVVMAVKTSTEDNNIKFSSESRDGWKSAKEHHENAVELHGQSRHREAYQQLRKAHNALRPAVKELLELPTAPPGLVEALSAEISRSAEWIAFMADHIDSHNAKATAHWKEGKRLYADAKVLHKDGKNKAAFIKWHDALKELDDAIVANWPAKTAPIPPG